MRWPTLIALGTAAPSCASAICLGVGFFTPASSQTPGRQLIVIIVVLGASILMLLLSAFIYRGRNWARCVLIGLCFIVILAILFFVVFVALAGEYRLAAAPQLEFAGIMFFVGLLSAPLFMIGLLTHPDVVKAFTERRDEV